MAYPFFCIDFFSQVIQSINIPATHIGRIGDMKFEMEYKGRKIWSEDQSAADPYRQRFADGISRYIEKRNRECKEIRRNRMLPKEVAENQELYREKYADMLGLKLFGGKPAAQPEMHYVGADEICRIFRLSIPITDEIPFYAMLFLPHQVETPMPLIIAQHGGGGTPELCSDMYGKNNYNHMMQRAQERGAAILAPQLLLWSPNETECMRKQDVLYNREKTDVDLKRFGSSITALEISGIMKALDYVSTLEEIDAKRVAMIGLSYGGYFTLHTMAADQRIKAGYCGAVFNDRDVYDWADWCYRDSALLYQDAEVAALCAPRKLFIQVGKKDQVFDYHSALPEAERISDYYEAFQAGENFRFSRWEGGHTISDSDEPYDFIFRALQPEE